MLSINILACFYLKWVCWSLFVVKWIKQIQIDVSFQGYDIGESVYVHVFGAYFGLAVSKVLTHNKIESKNEGESYNSDLFAMIGNSNNSKCKNTSLFQSFCVFRWIGTVFLFVYWVNLDWKRIKFYHWCFYIMWIFDNFQAIFQCCSCFQRRKESCYCQHLFEYCCFSCDIIFCVNTGD